MSSDVAGAAHSGGAPNELQNLDENNPRKPTMTEPPSPQEHAKTPESRHPANSHSRRSGGGQVPSRNQSGGNNECQFFFEDEVFRIDRKGHVHFGVVTGTAETYSSDEDDDVDEVLSKGEVRVAFYPDCKEGVHTEHSIGLADRTLMPGDVVRRRLPGQKDLVGQAGYVRDVNVRADVMVFGTKFVIRNVPAERLRPISEWTADVPVCSGIWIGTTVNVDETAVIKSGNGARLEITSKDFLKFKDAVGHCAREVFNPDVFFPGNLVVGRLPPPDRVKNLTPEIAPLSSRKNRAFYTVESIRTTSVNVAWTCRAISASEHTTEIQNLKQPKTTIKGEDLNNVKRLNIYESYVLQIHDRFYLKYSKCDQLVKHTDWEREQAEKYIPIYHAQKKMERKASKLNASPSSSGNARNAPKIRRVPNKFSGLRLPRPACDHCHKSSKRSKDDMLTSDDDDELDEDHTQPPEPSEPIDKQLKVTENADFATSASSAAAEGTGAQASRTTMRSVKRRHVKKKMRNVKKPNHIPLVRKETVLKDGEEAVVETLVVYSSVTVVWQDGTVEKDIPSTQLYPIHHLDNHEFFPGDFVSKANVNSTGATDYGVIQCVDHDERTAKVTWFNIYSHISNPIPLCKDLEELSVYDLKDHSDYQYRPGTLVIRVSNFTGENVDSTAGQVIDNYPDGRVRVWWAMGHITMCYPQDLFEINHNEQCYDAYESDGSEDSWETQSENSRVGLNLSLLSLDNDDHIIMGIDRATDAISSLEKLFRVLAPMHKADVLNDLLAVYKNCRVLDKILKSNFFDEDHFKGIVHQCTSDTAKQATEALAATPKDTSTLKLEMDTVVLSGQSTSTPTKRKSSTELYAVQCKKSADRIVDKEEEQVQDAEEFPSKVYLVCGDSGMPCNQLVKKYRNEYNERINQARESIAKAFENRTKNDSGVHSRGENTSEESNNPDGENKVVEESVVRETNLQTKDEFDVELVANRDPDVCEVFSFLIKEQMIKCREAVLLMTKLKSDRKDEDEEASDAEEVFADDEENQAQSKGTEADKKSDAVEVNEQPLNLNALSESLPAIDSPMACSSPSPSLISDPNPVCENCFQVLSNAPAAHHFIKSQVTPSNQAQYQRAIQREYRLLKASLPAGVIVRAYEDRMDLMSVMMVGPKRTPYQNALFFFDFQMGRDYPKSPPVCHYISYCTDRLNPNLYEEGRVCVSLLGTWSGRDNEVWSSISTMLQVLVSIQGLILVDEPYYNEAGYEKQRGTQLGNENSRVYNEMAIIKIAHSTVKQLKNPPLIFRNEVIEHFKEFGSELHGRMLAWSKYSLEAQRLRITSIKDMPLDYKAPCELPEFPLLPCSRGFCMAVQGVLDQLQCELTALGENQLSDERNSIAAGIGTAPRAAPEEI
ncbi:(E3-independent) E2 ubiquitin-conjugating enzyme UBE2O [Drosophila eugracilis]|uniref:(E3-independent) E2 ubiquitin-conjugating enzyme UBE2O n=1 Tax=Drosophila eugracilis TaxID=29029 RepID=UPI001BD95154|nr:(E3-independent) E2 ubiquitin-conjugating enzyme UBE2O [Drosophila eugracilis]